MSTEQNIGEPNKSVLFHLGQIEAKLDDLAETITAHIKEDHSIFFGNGKPGLVYEHVQLMSAFRWWRWIIGGSLATMSLAIFDLLLAHLGWR